MIATFKNKDIEKLYCEGVKAKWIPANLVTGIEIKLDIIREAIDINDLRVPPANHLEALKGKLKGFYSIRVNKQWRIIFKWQNNAAYDIDMVDYH